MMDLGRAMRDGKTIPRDREAARRLFENAMRAGDPGAKPALASMLYDDATGPTLVRLDELQKAAELGHPGALSQLGRAYLQGEGIPANPVQGRLLLERAVEAGHLHAAQSMGPDYLRDDHGRER